MPWHVSKNGCSAAEPWAVVKDADGSIAGCHPSKAAANRQIAALYANEDTMATARNTFPRPSAEILEAFVFNEAQHKRGSDGRFNKTGGRPSGITPKGGGKNIAGAKPTSLQEDDVPETSPTGARIVDFADGKATYTDGSVLTAQGWRNVPAKNKKRGRVFTIAGSADPKVGDGEEFINSRHDPKSGRFAPKSGGGTSVRKAGPPKMTHREPLPGERARAAKGEGKREKAMEQQFLRPKLKPPPGAKRSGSKPSPIPGRDRPYIA